MSVRDSLPTDSLLPIEDFSPTLLDVFLAILVLLSGAGAILGALILLFLPLR